MKDEIGVSFCKSFDEVKVLIDDWIGYYNNRFLFSQRKNAHILAVPLPLEEACPKTGKARGSYLKEK